MRDFVHLHCHTSAGSMLDALQSVDDLFDLVNLKGQKALAITDHGTLAAFFDAYKAYKRTGVKFIPGIEEYFVHSYDIIEPEKGTKGRKKTERRKHIVLLAQNETGYKNLLKINYLGFQHFVVSMGRVFPRINWEILEEHSEGIIATSACGNGILAEPIFQDNYNKAVEYAKRLADIFKGRFYLEIQPHALEDGIFSQAKLNNQLIKMSKELNLPLVTAVDAHYLTKSDATVHDVLMAINAKKPVDDPNRHRYGINEFYVKDGDEVYNFLAKFHGEEAAKEAVSNTVKIANMIEPPDYMESKGNHLPVFDPSKEADYKEFLEWREKSHTPENLPMDKAYMRFHIIDGFKRKFGHLGPAERKERWDRVKNELKILEGNNFSSYMLITADMIKWAKKNDILVGIGRGSVGGCMIAYLLGIHGVDPLEYGLLFERFQNAYKTDLPDIDTDFTSNGRDKVQEYVREKYGRDNCAQVSNINTYTPKNVIPDLVKSMRNVMPGLIPEGSYYVKIAEAIKAAIPEQDPDGKKVKTLERAMELSPKLRDFSSRCPELMEYADKIVSMPKEYSTHAAGMVVSDIPIYEFAPLRIDKNREIAVQYEKNRCESEGLVKMDFLAISTLDVIDETFKNIHSLKIGNAPKQMEDIPLNDVSTYEMIQRGETKCVFQLGKSSIMAALCKRIKPKNILDIAMINALGRPSAKGKPGEKGPREEYIDRRTGKDKVTYPHISLEKPLGETYGLAITEEQLMGIAGHVAGWDLNKADKLRKFTKIKGKDPDFALKLEAEFIEGMMNTHGVGYELAKGVWDKYVSGFSGYGFNKCLESLNFLQSEGCLVPLSQLSLGDKIDTFNVEKNIIEESVIKDIGKTDRKMKVFEVSFENGGKIRATITHKFLTPFGYKTLRDIILYSLPMIKTNDDCIDWSTNIHTNQGKLNHDVHKLYNEVGNISKVAREFKLSPDVAKNIINNKKTKRRHKVCNRFKDGIVDENTAYWFGFLCADGSVDKYKTTLELASYDFKHIEKFAGFLKDKGWFSYTRFRKNSRSVAYCVNSKELSSDLRRLGIPKNKNIESIDYSNIPEDLFRHFIRGFLDGDGSVSCFYYKGKRINIGVRGHVEILEKIRSHFNENIEGLQNVSIVKDGNSHSLWFRSKKDVLKIYEYLYNGSFIFLDRKRIRLERFINNKEDLKPWNDVYRGSYDGYKHIKTIEYVGIRDTYYVEVENNNHNYIMDGGVISANSHAVFYSINGYITAYLKCHYPAAFLAAYLKVKTARGGINRDDEINSAKNECRRLGIRIVPPDINKSKSGYEILDDKTIVMGLAAIKGMGEKALVEIISKQPFSSFVDFLYRVDGRIVNKAKIEALAKAGCFDSFKINRKDIHDEGKKVRDKMNAFIRKKVKDGYDVEMAIEDFPLKFSGNEWCQQEMLRHEQEVLGELVSGSIHDLFPRFFTNHGITLISKLKTLPNRHRILVEVIVKGFLREFKIKNGRNKGQRMAKYLVEDVMSNEVELTVWPSEYEKAKKLMAIGRPIRALCEVSDFNGAKTLMLKELQKVYGN